MSGMSDAPEWRFELSRLDGAYAPATMRSYRADLDAFEAWCDVKGEIPFPATVAVVCSFIEDEGRTKAPSTVQRRLYAIRKMHRLLRMDDPTDDEEINLSLRRVKRRRSVRPKQAKGLTRQYLARFLAAQPDSPIGVRNRAMLALGYDLLIRRSELIALTTHDLEEACDGSYRVLIRRSKSDQFGEGRLAFTSPQTATLLRTWLAVRGPEIEWLFCPVYKNRPINRGLSTTTVKRLIKQSALRAGLSIAEVAEFSAHSLRVGAAQDLLYRGKDTTTIMRAGGWTSINVLARYLKKAEHNVWT
ncbi:tyrosine-type recombinase/integrase [Roseicyclus marinus]|uniref:tyrosine-type recombinase/integrase n=1 Tax=Roseicyclus marinus TaxID=2161673 RepID=UPI00240F2B81|nr:tyrosine-type recombinase/integrase [Roseicyclus marinus]MDG3042474.1 tyrosine-type recombinase/integrase [Roseicyclus marinus]